MAEMCGVPGCEEPARELAMFRPGQAMVLDGAWAVTLRCGTGTHSAVQAAAAITRNDKDAQVLVIRLEHQLLPGRYEAVRTGAL